MTKRYDRPLSADELAAMPDEDIDFSDIPELDESFWSNARLVAPAGTEPVTLRLRPSVLEAFKSLGEGYEARMSAVLDDYAAALLRRPGG
jgi:uncharacterized protein (DUF4415 family)